MKISVLSSALSCLLLIPGVYCFVRCKRSGGGDALSTVIFKGGCTTLVLLNALAALPGADAWGVLIAAGLLFGLLGDVLLCREDGFLAGMACFAIGHLCYIAALLRLTARPLLALPVFAVLFGAVLFTALRLKSRLGSFFLPLLAYAVIISAMAALAASALSIERGWLLLCAAALFALSDILLAASKFYRPAGMGSDLFRQYCYFGGQALFALCISIL